MKLCVIPARGGSKRIPRKNIKPFCGKPMIAWSIEAAIKSNCFDKIIVSTDDDEIADFACKCGAEVPFLRPNELSDDYMGTSEVVSHAIKWNINNGYKIKEVCCLYATATFVRATDLSKALKILEENDIDYVFTVTSYAFPIQRAIEITDNNRVKMVYPKYYDTRSQDLKPCWHDAGQFYWAHKDTWLENKPIFESSSIPLILPRYRVQDIDTVEDWKYAELMFNSLRFGGM